ncbi:MAG: DUF5050 domain-containing protein [Lachnospiraceae bacterium]|nr:DUF5050 domain-containing protein [Lachnospiraceae bacterium]
MNQKVKTVLIFIIVLSVFTSLVLLGKINSRLPENPSDYAGNTAGNLYNRGLFAQDDTYIYFANLSDRFRLYRMDSSLERVERINTDSVEYINLDASSTFLYYSRINYRQNTLGSTVFDILGTGIYRCSLKSRNITRLYPNSCGTVLLAGNRLFYQAHGEDGSFDLYERFVNTKKTEDTLITAEYINPACYHDGLLYYSGVTKDHCLYTYQPETGRTSLFAELDCYQPIATDTGVYFLSQPHNYALFHLPYTSDTATLITENRLSSYNLSADGRTLFYQVDNGKNNRICRYDIASKEETTLLEGDYKNLNTVFGYLFFTDFLEHTCYCYDINADILFVFAPEAAD